VIEPILVLGIPVDFILFAQSERDRNNADSPRPFSGARRVVAAQFALGPRSRAAPASSCAGAAHHFALIVLAVLRAQVSTAQP